MRDCLGENLHLYYPYITRIFIYPYIIDTSNFCAIVFVPRPSLGFVCQQCLTFVVSVQCYALLSRISFFLRAFACAFVLLLCSVLHFRFPSAVSFPTLSTHDPVPKLRLFARFMFFFGAFVFFQTFLPTIPYGHSLFGVSKSHNSTTRMRNAVRFPSLLCELLFIVVALKPSQSSPFVSPSCLNPRNV